MTQLMRFFIYLALGAIALAGFGAAAIEFRVYDSMKASAQVEELLTKLNNAATINVKIAQDTNAATRASARLSERTLAAAARSAEHFEKVTLVAVDDGVKDFRKAISDNSKEIHATLRATTSAVAKLESGPIEESAKTLKAGGALLEYLRTGPVAQSTVTLKNIDFAVIDFRARVNQFQPILEDVHGITTDAHKITTDGAAMTAESRAYLHAIFNPTKEPFWIEWPKALARAAFPGLVKAGVTRVLPDVVEVKR